MRDLVFKHLARRVWLLVVVSAGVAAVAYADFVGRPAAVARVTGTDPISSTPSFTPNISIGQFAGGVSGVVPGSVGGTTNFLRADGAWAQPSGTYPSSGSVTISQNAWPGGTTALSTVGTLDWMLALQAAAFTGYPNTPRVYIDAWRNKVLGGYIYQSFDWVYNGGSVGLYTSQQGKAFSTVAGDDTSGASTIANAYINYAHCTTVGGINFGYRFRAPAMSTARVLHLLAGVNSGTITVRAALSDGSGSNTATLTAALNNNASAEFIITFNSARDGANLAVSVLLTTNAGGASSDVWYQAAWLTTP